MLRSAYINSFTAQPPNITPNFVFIYCLTTEYYTQLSVHLLPSHPISHSAFHLFIAQPPNVNLTFQPFTAQPPDVTLNFPFSYWTATICYIKFHTHLQLSLPWKFAPAYVVETVSKDYFSRKTDERIYRYHSSISFHSVICVWGRGMLTAARHEMCHDNSIQKKYKLAKSHCNN